jgi:hypothetical protein
MFEAKRCTKQQIIRTKSKDIFVKVVDLKSWTTHEACNISNPIFFVVVALLVALERSEVGTPIFSQPAWRENP